MPPMRIQVGSAYLQGRRGAYHLSEVQISLLEQTKEGTQNPDCQEAEKVVSTDRQSQTNSTAFSCVLCGEPYDAFPPDDLHTFATRKAPPRDFLESGLCIEIPYVCLNPDCFRENVLYWHNTNMEKGEWHYKAVDEDLWGEIVTGEHREPVHEVKTSDRMCCGVCGSKVTYLVHWVRIANVGFPFKGTTNIVDEYKVMCGNIKCRKVLAKVKLTKDGRTEEIE